MSPPGSGEEKHVPPAQERASRGPRDFLTILFKHRSKVSVIFLATVLAAILWSFLIPPAYEAKSILMVKIGKESTEEVVNSEIRILSSRALIEKALATLKVETVYPDLARTPPSGMTPLQAAVPAFGKNLTVEGVRKSNVIEVSFRHKDPRVAARAVNLLVDDYKEKHLQVFSDPQSSFLEQQLAEYEQKLKQSESRMEAFKQKNRVFSLEEQRSLLLKQRMELDTSLKTTKNQVDELQNKLSSLRSQQRARTQDKSIYTLSERDRIIVDAQSRLLSLQLQEQDLLKQYQEDNRFVVNTRKEIRLVQEFLKDQETEIGGKVRTGNPVSQEVEKETIKTRADLSSQNAKAAALTKQVGTLENEIKSFDLLDNEFQTLKREVVSNEKNYRTYLERLEEARISEDMNRKKIANISVIQAAAVPAKPIKPKKGLNILLGMILGLTSGLGFAFFSEYTSESFSTPGIAEKQLALPVLTTIPHRD